MEIIKPGYTRVTEITSTIHDFSNINPQVLKRKALIGSEVHNAIDLFFQGELAILDERPRNYFESFQMYRKSDHFKDMNILKREERYYSDKLRITGRIDLLASKEGKTLLIDWKTSSAACMSVWRLQLAFYKILIQENLPEYDVEQGIVIQLTERAQYTMHLCNFKTGVLTEKALQLLEEYRKAHPLPCSKQELHQ